MPNSQLSQVVVIRYTLKVTADLVNRCVGWAVPIGAGAHSLGLTFNPILNPILNTRSDYV